MNRSNQSSRVVGLVSIPQYPVSDERSVDNKTVDNRFCNMEPKMVFGFEKPLTFL
jgi:hypothetical protein